jgi:hypothetical protein
VIEIIRHSNFVFSKQRQDASAVCSVTFRIKGIIFKPFELIHNCEVRKIDKNGHIICKNEHASVYIHANKFLQSITKGQIIVARAGVAAYKIFKPECSIPALPFVPVFNKSSNTIFKLVVPKDMPLVNTVMKLLREGLKNQDDLTPYSLKFFTELMYPYASTSVLDATKDVKVTSFESLLKQNIGTEVIISQPEYTPLSAPNLLVHSKLNINDMLGSKDVTLSNGNIVISEDFDSVVAGIIQLYIEHLYAINMLSTTYHTEELIKKSNSLWSLYRNNRRA